MERTCHINKQRMSRSSVVAATTPQRPGEPWGISGRKGYLPSSSHRRFPGSSAGKEFACNAGDPGSISGSGRFPGEGIGYLLQYSWDFQVAQLVKNPPAMRETWVLSLGWEDPLEGYPLQYSGLENSMDYSIVYGVLQTKILEWVAFPFSRGSAQFRDWTQVFCIAGGFFTSWATREAQENWSR